MKKKLLIGTIILTLFLSLMSLDLNELEPNEVVTDSGVKTITQIPVNLIGSLADGAELDFWKINPNSSGDLNFALTSGSNLTVRIYTCSNSDYSTGRTTLSTISSFPNTVNLPDNTKYYSIRITAASTTSYQIALSGTATLPVELSSFTAVLCNTNNVALNWTSQSESNLLGYNVYRSSTNDQMSAVKVNASTIQATNTSTEHSYEFIDAQINEGEYYYWLQTVEQNNEYAFHGPVTVTYSSNPGTPDPQYQYKHRLVGAYPNPFNPNTSIRYEVQGPTNVKIEIFNNKGQKVASYQKYHAAKGSDAFNWNGKDFNGKTVSTGVYFSTMTAGKYQETKKMIMMK